MKIKFLVEVELKRVQGKFASKDDMAEAVQMDLEEFSMGTYYSPDDAEYETANVTVARVEE